LLSPAISKSGAIGTRVLSIRKCALDLTAPDPENAMRRFVLGLMPVLLCAPALAQEEPTAARDSLLGPVRSVRASSTGSGSDDVVFVYAYDRAGRRTEWMTYMKDDLRSRLVYVYDERGRHVGLEHYAVPHAPGMHGEFRQPAPGTPLPTRPERQVYVLDDAGRRIETRDFRVDGTLVSRYTVAYDSAGRMREEASFRGNGELGWKTVHEYDAAGRPRLRRFISDGGRESRTVFDYDERGNQVLEESDTADVRFFRRKVTRYDGAGRKSEEEVYYRAQPRWRIEYRYDAEGRLRERETFDSMPHEPSFPPSPERGKVVYTYFPDGGRTVEIIDVHYSGLPYRRRVERIDARGKMVGWEDFHPDGTRVVRHIHDPALGRNRQIAGPTRWFEELDGHGNWIRRGYLVVPDDGATPLPLWEMVREITYW
jgi:YD repeat-containing protein